MSPPAEPATNLRRAAALMVLSSLAFAVMGAAVKVASTDVTNTMIVFFRNAVALVLLLPWVVKGGPAALATRQFRGHLVRGSAGLGAMACSFYAIGRLRLADGILLNQSFPLFLPLAEWLWMRERVLPGVWRSLTLGFAGVLLVLKPGSGLFTPVALVGLASAALAAIAQVGVRRLTYTEPVARIVFYFALIAATGSALALPLAWRTPSALGWTALAATGVFATMGQFALTRAYVHAPAALVGPFIYTGVVFAAAIDWLAWRTLPDRFFVPGALLIAAAGAWMLHHDAGRRVPPLPD